MTTEKRPAPAPAPTNVRNIQARAREISEAHRAHLRTSGLTDETIELAGIYTERDPGEMAKLLNWRGAPRGVGTAIVFPFFLPDAAQPYMARLKFDTPLAAKGDKDSVRKYEQPRERPVGPYFPPRSRALFADLSRPVIITEGEKKSLTLDQLGYVAVGLTGVSCAHDIAWRKAHEGEPDEWRFHELIRAHVPMRGREVVVCFDSDAAEKQQVMRAARVVSAMALAEGATDVKFVEIPHGEGAKKLGIDDFFVTYGEERTRELLAAAVPFRATLEEASRVRAAQLPGLRGAPIPAKLVIPLDYEVAKDGSIWRVLEERREIVSRSPILVARSLRDSTTGEVLFEVVFRWLHRWESAIVPRAAICDSRGLIGALAKLGAPVTSNTAASVVQWFADFTEENSRRIEEAHSLSRCGWHRVAGERVFGFDEPISRSSSTLELVMERSGPRGGMLAALGPRCDDDAFDERFEAHKQALKAAWDASPECALAISAALAAPLLDILDAKPFAVHLFGDSSTGKSTMLKIAASVYGDSTSANLVANWNATIAGLEQRASMMSDLPLFLDEAGVADARTREQAVYMLVNGGGRARGSKDMQGRAVAAWRTIVISTGERALVDDEAATGAQARVLQAQVTGFGELDAMGVDLARAACDAASGAVGVAWLQRLVEMTPEEIAKVREQLARAKVDFAAALASGGVGGRRAEVLAVLGVTESVAAQVLGIGEANGSTVARAGLRVASATRVDAAVTRGADVVASWFAMNRGLFGETSIDVTGARVTRGSHREVLGYYDDERIYVPPASLAKALDASGISLRVVAQQWAMTGVLEGQSGRLTPLCRIDGHQARYYVFRRPALEGLLPGNGGSPVTGLVTG